MSKAKNAAAVSLGKRRLKSLSPERRREIAILGGQASAKAFAALSEEERTDLLARRKRTRDANRMAREET